MAQKILCTCGKELTIRKNLGVREDIPVVAQCPYCTLSAYHFGWVDGDGATTEVVTTAGVLALMGANAI